MQLVSVIVITYNAQKYVIECLESIERQTYPDIEIIISDDKSTDQTLAIINEFAKKTKRKIRMNANHSRMGTFKNLQKAFEMCNGEFIAYLEGDDYWYDDHKIYKQLAALNQFKNISAIATQSYRLNNDVLSLYRDEVRKQYELKDLIGYTPFHSSTLLFKKNAIERLPNRFQNCVSNDKTLYLLCALNSPILFLNEITSVYRMHQNSISGSGRPIILHLKQLQWLWHANIHTQWKYAKTILMVAWKNHIRLILKQFIHG